MQGRVELDIPAGTLASVIPIALVHTIVAPLCADEVRQCLRVLGDVGGAAVVADAGVGQSVGIAVVLLGRH
jgi:hypothetical protein